jgi:lia operon protein LiaG
MKKAVIILALFVIPLAVFSQMKKYEYTPKVKSKIEIKDLLGAISFKNASGSAIVIESDFNMERPKRADGLKLLGSAEDNTNLGLNVNEENGVVSVTGIVSKGRDYKYIISVPQGMAVNLNYSSPFVNGDIEIDNYKGVMEMNTLNANVKIANSSGPFTVNSVSGDIEVVFSGISQDGPTSLATVSGLVDVTIPSSEKATFEVKSFSGDVYNNLDLKKMSKEGKDDRAEGLGSIKSGGDGDFTLNGGGQKVILRSISGNIYLRKK